MKRGKNEIDMCNGPLFGKILLFTIPLMLSSMLQLMFNAADVIVVGNFVGDTALAAVGSTGALINLLINVFIGFSVGTNVLVARYYGAQQEREVQETIHTAIAMALVCGVFLIGVGFFASKPLLSLMGTPDAVLEQAALYMRVYFLGMPVNLLYNFGSAILRAVGDTRRPLYYLFGSGVVNVFLNLALILFCGMGVEGVAIATIVSQAIAAVLVVRCLLRSEGTLHLELSQIRFVRDKVKKIVRIGLPAGMQGAIFSISNVLIQSSVNSFGSIAMAGGTAAANIENFIYVSMNACQQTAVSFVSQNLGAKKLDRIKKVCIQCIALVLGIGFILGVGSCLAREFLIGVYSNDAEAIHYGARRLLIVAGPYLLCGFMDTMVGCIRGLGYSVVPMIVSLLGACGMRVLWIFTIFQWKRSWEVLFLSYPVSWIITGSAHLICFIVLYHGQIQRMQRSGIGSGHEKKRVIY